MYSGLEKCIKKPISEKGIDNQGYFLSTLWKFHNFSISQILREINFGDSRSVKFANLTHLEALNLNS